MTLHRDRATGALLRQITSHPSVNHPTYFLQSSFLPGDEALVFTSYRTGSPQIFHATYPEGELQQLTDGIGIHPFSAMIHSGGEHILFVRGSAICELALATRNERVVAQFPGAELGECASTRDGEWLTAAVKQGVERGLVIGKRDGSGWHFVPFPRTVIHPQFHPLDPEWLIFAGDPAPRMYRVRRQGEGDPECLYEHDNNEFVVHETFLGDTGDVVFTVWPKLLARLNWDTRQIAEIARCNAWHIAPNRAGSEILYDTNHPDRGIFRLHVASGREQRVCYSDSSNGGSQWASSRYALAEDFAAARGGNSGLSWMENAADTVYGPQWTHPHPAFSATETKVTFASDRTGHPQVYVCELGSANA